MLEIDTSRPTEIEGVPGRIFGPLMLCIAAAMVCVAVSFSGNGKAIFAAFALGVAALIIFWHMGTLRGAIVTLTPEGIRDTRVANTFVPWSVVRSVSPLGLTDQKSGGVDPRKWGLLHSLATGSFTGETIIVLAVDPRDALRLGLPQLLRGSRGFNRVLPIDGLCMTAEGLQTDHDTLLVLSTAYADKASKKPVASPQS